MTWVLIKIYPLIMKCAHRRNQWVYDNDSSSVEIIEDSFIKSDSYGINYTCNSMGELFVPGSNFEQDNYDINSSESNNVEDLPITNSSLIDSNSRRMSVYERDMGVVYKIIENKFNDAPWYIRDAHNVFLASNFSIRYGYNAFCNIIKELEKSNKIIQYKVFKKRAKYICITKTYLISLAEEIINKAVGDYGSLNFTLAGMRRKFTRKYNRPKGKLFFPAFNHLIKTDKIRIIRKGNHNEYRLVYNN